MDKKCVHDFSENSTLKKSPKQCFVHPKITYYFCTVCKECFQYQDSDGQPSLVKKNS